jgi:hypothetical protein
MSIQFYAINFNIKKKHINVTLNLNFAYFRYFLENDRPSQTTNNAKLKNKFYLISFKVNHE